MKEQKRLEEQRKQSSLATQHSHQMMFDADLFSQMIPKQDLDAAQKREDDILASLMSIGPQNEPQPIDPQTIGGPDYVDLDDILGDLIQNQQFFNDQEQQIKQEREKAQQKAQNKHQQQYFNPVDHALEVVQAKKPQFDFPKPQFKQKEYDQEVFKTNQSVSQIVPNVNFPPAAAVGIKPPEFDFDQFSSQ